MSTTVIFSTTPLANVDDAGEKVKLYFGSMELYMLILTIVAIVILILTCMFLCYRRGLFDCCCRNDDDDDIETGSRPRRRVWGSREIDVSLPPLYVPPTAPSATPQKNQAKKNQRGKKSPGSHPSNGNRPKPLHPSRARKQQKPKVATMKVGRRFSLNPDRVVLGQAVLVEGYPCQGIVRFIGKHHENGKPRIGVELDEPIGKNNGTIGGCQYFSCDAKKGILTVPQKISPVQKKKGKGQGQGRGSPNRKQAPKTQQQQHHHHQQQQRLRVIQQQQQQQRQRPKQQQPQQQKQQKKKKNQIVLGQTPPLQKQESVSINPGFRQDSVSDDVAENPGFGRMQSFL